MGSLVGNGSSSSSSSSSAAGGGAAAYAYAPAENQQLSEAAIAEMEEEGLHVIETNGDEVVAVGGDVDGLDAVGGGANAIKISRRQLSARNSLAN